MKNPLTFVALIGAGLLVGTQALAGGTVTPPSLPGPGVFGLIALGVGASIFLGRGRR